MRLFEQLQTLAPPAVLPAPSSGVEDTIFAALRDLTVEAPMTIERVDPSEDAIGFQGSVPLGEGMAKVQGVATPTGERVELTLPLSWHARDWFEASDVWPPTAGAFEPISPFDLVWRTPPTVIIEGAAQGPATVRFEGATCVAESLAPLLEAFGLTTPEVSCTLDVDRRRLVATVSRPGRLPPVGPLVAEAVTIGLSIGLQADDDAHVFVRGDGQLGPLEVTLDGRAPTYDPAQVRFALTGRQAPIALTAVSAVLGTDDAVRGALRALRLPAPTTTEVSLQMNFPAARVHELSVNGIIDGTWRSPVNGLEPVCDLRMQVQILSPFDEDRRSDHVTLTGQVELEGSRLAVDVIPENVELCATIEGGANIPLPALLERLTPVPLGAPGHLVVETLVIKASAEPPQVSLDAEIVGDWAASFGGQTLQLSGRDLSLRLGEGTELSVDVEVILAAQPFMATFRRNADGTWRLDANDEDCDLLSLVTGLLGDPREPNPDNFACPVSLAYETAPNRRTPHLELTASLPDPVELATAFGPLVDPAALLPVTETTTIGPAQAVIRAFAERTEATVRSADGAPLSVLDLEDASLEVEALHFAADKGATAPRPPTATGRLKAGPVDIEGKIAFEAQGLRFLPADDAALTVDVPLTSDARLVGTVLTPGFTAQRAGELQRWQLSTPAQVRWDEAPPALLRLTGEQPEAAVDFGPHGMTLRLEPAAGLVSIPAAPLDTGIGLKKLGDFKVTVDELAVEVAGTRASAEGRLRGRGTVRLPAETDDLLQLFASTDEPLTVDEPIAVSVAIGPDDGLTVQLNASPLANAEIIDRDGQAWLDIAGEHGRLAVALDDLRLTDAGLTLRTRVTPFDLRLPLGLVRNLLMAANAGPWAEAVPESVPFGQAMPGLAEGPDAWIAWLASHGVPDADAMRPLVDQIAGRGEALPAVLRDGLQGHLPSSFNFHAVLAEDGSIALRMGVPRDDDAEPSPATFAWPMPTPDGLQLAVLRLWSAGGGTLGGGTLGRLDVDAEVELYALTAMAEATTPSALTQRLTLRNVTAALFRRDGRRVPVPIFADTFGLHGRTSHGLGIESSFGFVAPAIPSPAMAALFLHLGRAFDDPDKTPQAQRVPDIVFRIGPQRITLPRYLGGSTLGASHDLGEIRTFETAAKVLAAPDHLDPVDLVDAIPAPYRRGEHPLSIGPFNVKATWTVDQLRPGDRASERIRAASLDDDVPNVLAVSLGGQYPIGGETAVDVNLTTAWSRTAGFQAGLHVQGALVEPLALVITGRLNPGEGDRPVLDGDGWLTARGRRIFTADAHLEDDRVVLDGRAELFAPDAPVSVTAEGPLEMREDGFLLDTEAQCNLLEEARLRIDSAGCVLVGQWLDRPAELRLTDTNAAIALTGEVHLPVRLSGTYGPFARSGTELASRIVLDVEAIVRVSAVASEHGSVTTVSGSFPWADETWSIPALETDAWLKTTADVEGAVRAHFESQIDEVFDPMFQSPAIWLKLVRQGSIEPAGNLGEVLLRAFGESEESAATRLREAGFALETSADLLGVAGNSGEDIGRALAAGYGAEGADVAQAMHAAGASVDVARSAVRGASEIDAFEVDRVLADAGYASPMAPLPTPPEAIGEPTVRMVPEPLADPGPVADLIADPGPVADLLADLAEDDPTTTEAEAAKGDAPTLQMLSPLYDPAENDYEPPTIVAAPDERERALWVAEAALARAVSEEQRLEAELQIARQAEEARMQAAAAAHRQLERFRAGDLATPQEMVASVREAAKRSTDKFDEDAAGTIAALEKAAAEAEGAVEAVRDAAEQSLKDTLQLAIRQPEAAAIEAERAAKQTEASADALEQQAQELRRRADALEGGAMSSDPAAPAPAAVPPTQTVETEEPADGESDPKKGNSVLRAMRKLIPW